jgi:hypothetical protein
MTLAAVLLGSVAFVVFAFALPVVRGQGWRWVPPKLVFLVCFWGAVIMAVNFMSRLHP